MKALVLAALACLCALPMAAQNNQAVQVAVDPAGACGFPQSLRYNYVNGKLWGCVNGTWAQISGGVGGTGNAANEVAVAFSATPTYTCGSASAGTATHFTVAALTANVTSSTLATCTAGQTIGFHFVQDGTGGRTVAMPTNWDSLTIDATASTATEASYWYDGTNGRLTSVNGKATPFLIGQAPERTEPTTAVSCPSGQGCAWWDQTDHALHEKANNSGTVRTTVVPLTCTAPAVLTAIAAGGGTTCTTPVLTLNSQIVAYTTVLGDAGKMLLHPTADNNARTFTIDSNANVAYPNGTCITFTNQINTLTIAITTDTMTLMGANTTGSRTLAAGNWATACKVASTSWVIGGSSGLT